MIHALRAGPRATRGPSTVDAVKGYPIDRRTPAQIAAASASVLGDFEAKAARVVARLTGEEVTIQDDNTHDGMPDIRINYTDGRTGFVEVVTDIDRSYAETYRRITRQNDKGSSLRLPGELRSPSVHRIWFVTLSNRANLRNINDSLPALLAKIETNGEFFESVTTQETLAQVTSQHSAELVRLGVVEIASRAPRESETERHKDGIILLYPGGIQGPADVTWDDFYQSLSELLASNLVLRKVSKLWKAGGDDSHIFIGTSFTTRWAIYRALSMDVQSIPPTAPDLPERITHLWLMGAQTPDRCLVWFQREQWCGHSGPGWLDASRNWATE